MATLVPNNRTLTEEELKTFRFNMLVTAVSLGRVANFIDKTERFNMDLKKMIEVLSTLCIGITLLCDQKPEDVQAAVHKTFLGEKNEFTDLTWQSVEWFFGKQEERPAMVNKQPSPGSFTVEGDFHA